MSNESAFLQSLLASPIDDDVRLVYASWLEEQNEPAADARAELLRLTAALAASPDQQRAEEMRQRLQ